MKTLLSAVAVLAGANSVSAFWRMPCRSRTGAARLDPIMDPDTISDHVHTFHGGGAISDHTTYEDLTASSTCTSCEVTQDNSAYWTPTMHFMFSNGTSEMVEQVGGMLAYYLMYLEDPSTLDAFPAGLRMVAGNRNVRNFTGPFPDEQLSWWPTNAEDQFFLQQRAIGFNCLNYDVDPEPSLYRHQFPSKEYMDANCTDGVRLELAFPSCGNGSTDSADHQSHMAYPSLVKEGNCPEGFDQKYPFLFFETIWATDTYAGVDGYFTLSHGDPIGTGYHGDFIMGWDEDFLQSAIKTCTNMSGEIEDCPLFTFQNDSVGAECTFEAPTVLQDDDVFSPRDGLAVDVPIQWGPEPATMYPVAGKDGVATSSLTAYSVPLTLSAAPTLQYTAANASETSTAQGGIVVAVEASASTRAVASDASTSTSSSVPSTSASSNVPVTSASSSVPSTSASSSSSTAAPSSYIITAPSLEPSSSPGNVIATSYITKGNEVIEMVVEQVDVTVTASATGMLLGKHKRHMHKHQHGHRF